MQDFQKEKDSFSKKQSKIGFQNLKKAYNLNFHNQDMKFYEYKDQNNLFSVIDISKNEKIINQN